jgi:hypothetical protein
MNKPFKLDPPPIYDEHYAATQEEPSFAPESSADSSPSFAEVIPCVTSQVAGQEETVENKSLPPMTERDKREAIDRAQRSMERWFLMWHFTGCFASAAGYQKARENWERALMKWGA